MKKSIFGFLCLFFFLSSGICDSEKGPITVQTKVQSITITPITEISVQEGSTVTLTAIVLPTNATNQAIIWSSANSAIATVSAIATASGAGVVTGVAVGSTTIRATAADGSGVFTEKTIDVTLATTVEVKVQSISITPATAVSVEVGKTITLSATVLPANAANKAVTWTSVTPAIATVVAGTGVVTGVAAGSTTIRATATDGSGVYADKTIGVTSVTLPPTGGSVGPRANTYDDPANGIYVSPTGYDATATGTIDKPYKSINTALAAAAPGSTIVLRGGTYKEGRDVRVRKSNITIKSRKGEWAIIDLTTYNSGHGEDSGIEFYAENEVTGGIVKDCKLQCVEVKGGFYAVSFETKWEWGQADRSGASNIIIEDCKLHDTKNDVVKVKPGCANIIIRYNEIYNSGREHVSHPDFQLGERNSEGIDNVNGNNMLVQNNYIHDICSNAIYAKGGAINAVIENNLIKNAYGAGIMVGFDTSPQYFDTKVNPQYYENISGIVRNNLIIHTGWEGIGFYGSKDGEVYNNTLVDVNYAQNYHSAVYFGTPTQDYDAKAGRPATVNPKFHHNIVSQPAAFTKRPMIEIRFLNELGGVSALSGNPTMNNNCYFIAGKSATFNDMRPGKILSNAGFAAWKTHISGDSGSLEVNPSLNADYMPTNTQCTGMGIQFPLK